MTKISKNTLRLIAAALCVAMLVFGGLIGKTAAALLEGDDADLEMGMATVKVDLLENGNVVASSGEEGILFESISGTKADPGYTYQDTVAARNSGNSPQYVRIIIKKYWTDADGKVTTVDPALIELTTGDGWFENADERSTEQSVYYCKKSVAPGEDSAPLFTGVRINGSIAEEYKIEADADDPNTLKATYAYDGLSFNVEAEAQAIQYEHANEAVGSAWGVTGINFADGTVSKQ